MKELIEFIARTLVEQPESVEVEAHPDERRLDLRVADEDLGRMIGRRGKTARAMRSLLAAASSEPYELRSARARTRKKGPIRSEAGWWSTGHARESR